MHPRKLTHNTIPAMPLAEFVKRSYPAGLGASFEIVEKLIAGNERAMLAWDKGHRQLVGCPACEMELSRVGGRDDDTCLPELRRLPLPG